MDPAETKKLILQSIHDKSSHKRDVYENTIAQFTTLKDVLASYAEDLKSEMEKKDKRIRIEFNNKGETEARLTIAGDTLIFHMHTNVFQFDRSSHLWNSSYLKDNESRGYTGTINIYNFLYDSLYLNRINDLGYMIGRIFINAENHFLVEGKRQMGYLYNDFINNVLDEKQWLNVINSAVLYALDFDLYVPPYDEVNLVTVSEIQELSHNLQLKTGKRLGFQFTNVNDSISS